MAAAAQVACSFFGVVFERLNSLIYNVQIKKLGPLVKEQLTKLFKTFLKIKEVLDDAEEKQFNEKADRVRFWLQELNNAAYEADDVFDEFEYEALQQAEDVSSNNVTEQLNGRIQKLIVIFHELAEECSGLELQKQKEKSVVVSPDRITISLLTEPQVCGRDEDIEKLVKQLMGLAYLTLPQFRTRGSNYWAKHPTASRKPVLNDASSSSSMANISVFPILGMGGLGKTTLAQLVYNDERVENHFKHRSWICVSDDFDIKRLMKAIIASISGSECNLKDLEPLQQRLRKEVHGKRFLFVLDDVWEENQEKWDKMMGFFEGGAQGSSIIVTTRLERVASITSKLLPHCLNSLSRKNCWALFKKYAFGSGNEETKALVKIGKAIVKKCGGLPLAAKTMGCLLRFKNGENEWNEVKDNAIWELPQSSVKGILPALRLSYHHLPSTLRQCFVYCSIFSKDFNIEKERLIQLWIANGLVQSRAKIELEDVGNEIFTALLQRSFFQDIQKDEYGGIIICKMHDLVHDLASYIAGDEYFAQDVESARNITERTRHLSLLSYSEIPPTSILKSMHRSLPCLRSLILLSEKYKTLKFVFSDFILLRELDLHNCEIEVVPDRIGEMVHLRYLNLSRNPFTSLPESICLLNNMQTMKLTHCFKLESLPKNLIHMSNLRHVGMEECDGLSEMPIGIGQLTCLQRLSDFIVGEGNRIGQLQLLNNLRVKLIIKGLRLVETSTEAQKANLMSKKNLHSLGLYWGLCRYSHLDSDSDSSSRQHRDQNVIESLQPHVNVRELEVAGYQGFLSLEVLDLAGMDNLEGWSSSSSSSSSQASTTSAVEGFSSLEGLSLEEPMHTLEGSSSSCQAAAATPTSAATLFPALKSKSASSSSQAAAAATPAPAAVFPCLKRMSLLNCPKLKGGIQLAWSPVQDVHIEGSNCNGMVLGSLRDLPCLPSLEITGFVELEYFPPGTLTNLTALHNLEIGECGLKALPVQLYSLTKLTELEIWGCPNLVSLGEEREGGLKNLSSLRTLVIERCEAVKRLPELKKTSLVTLIIKHCLEMEFSNEDFEHLVVLESLHLSGLPKLTCFPEGIKHSAATLQILNFRPCRGNVEMDLPDWISTLPSLKYLKIDAPKNWQVLPQWMQHLIALKILQIHGCDEELVDQWKELDEQREDNHFNIIFHGATLYLKKILVG